MTGEERRALRVLLDADRRQRVKPAGEEQVYVRIRSLPETAFDAADGDPLLALALACDAVKMRRGAER